MEEPKHASAPQRMPFKDKLTTALAVAAFVISAGSAYLNLIQQTDDLRVILSEPFVFRPTVREGRLWLLPSEKNLVFVNRGNRAAVVMSALVYIVEAADEKEC